MIVDGGPVGRFGCFFGAVTASLPLNPGPITTATCTRGPVIAATAAGHRRRPVALPTMWARSAAAAAAPGR